MADTNVKIAGGKGGAVLLITGTLFVGYLYLTRRLPKVIQAISTPTTGNEYTNPGITVPSGGTAPYPAGPPGSPNTVPINPTTPGTTNGPPVSVTPGGYPRRFVINFPPGYAVPSIEISASDPISCRSEVFAGVLQATGSFTLASIYANQNC